ncbi:MAG: hypothetical protein U0105_09095 [Candidatus Obscuribacterales bacterium]
MAEILNDECDAIGSIVAGACKLAEEAVKELGDLGRAPKLQPAEATKALSQQAMRTALGATGALPGMRIVDGKEPTFGSMIEKYRRLIRPLYGE